jgi:malonyl-CoA/methylmalonyl-CoA synthetase
MDDRTLHVPRHSGPTVLPAHPFFNRLVRFAHAVPPRLCVRDDNSGLEATHLQVLTDVLAFRQRVWESFSPAVRQQLDDQDEVYIAILAAGGYEYTVAVLAALALGAAVVPMTVMLPPEEALYFATKSRAAAVLCSSAAMDLGTALVKLVKKEDPNSTFAALSIAPSLHNAPLKPVDIKISSDRYLSDNAPGVVIFTSGTTGPPKGAVMRRGFIFDVALSVADHYDLGPKDTMLHLLPVHHATGIGMNFFPGIVSGCVLEFKSGSFSAEWTWERWRQGGITVFSGVPTIYMRMMRYFEQNLASKSNVTEYLQGARSIKACLCGTSALPKPIADFWAQILGKRIVLRYGATEFGAVFKVRLGDDNVPDGSVGNMFAGCDVKLRNEETGEYGDEGEVVVKSPAGELFSKYIWDPQATAKAHLPDGYYRTGDIARREGDYYWILGRASIDIIKSGGYKISALDIEREILALPYVAEVMVVGVPDLEFGERVAAAVVLKEPEDQKDDPVTNLSLERLRQDLRVRLAGYKMPTILRLIKGELPKSGTGKVVKKVLGPQFFPKNYLELSGEIEAWSPPKTKAKL